MQDENKLLSGDEQRANVSEHRVNASEQNQSTTDASEQSRHRIDYVARRFKFQCRLLLILFIVATIMSICIATVGSVISISYAGMD
jgi:hypothetical protein